MRIMVTGGAGYIGSHAAQYMLERGDDVLIVDNLYRGHLAAVDRLAGSLGDPSRLTFAEADCTDRDRMTEFMRTNRVEAVIHFAALAYVGESVESPLDYHRVNTGGMTAMLSACERAGVARFIFSSTCATYGQPEAQPISEDTPQHPINPYGASKLHAERVLADYADACRAAGKPFAAAALRYFNVAGADPSGLLGEWHVPETHLVPIILEAAAGRRDRVTVHGDDYPTPDGTCIRDYVHVRDLVEAHAAVLDRLEPGELRRYNIGTGTGHSVAEVIESARRVTGRGFTVEVGPRRPGDPPRLVADASKIEREIGWHARYTTIDEIVRTAWDWSRANPGGYSA